MDLVMEAFLLSTGIVALAEMGDKTQLLALILAARFRKPWPIVCGILVATVANHAMAGALGAWVTTVIGPTTLRWILGASFIAMAVWMLIPDKMDDEETQAPPRWGVFGTTVVAFFLAEMGDKTQIATVALAARFRDLVPVVAGTTLGMLIADVPAVFVGDRLFDDIWGARNAGMRAVHLPHSDIPAEQVGHTVGEPDAAQALDERDHASLPCGTREHRDGDAEVGQVIDPALLEDDGRVVFGASQPGDAEAGAAASPAAGARL